MLRLAKKEPVNGDDGTTNDPSRRTSYRTSCGVTLLCGSNYFRQRAATGNGFELRVGQNLGSDLFGMHRRHLLFKEQHDAALISSSSHERFR